MNGPYQVGGTRLSGPSPSDPRWKLAGPFCSNEPFGTSQGHRNFVRMTSRAGKHPRPEAANAPRDARPGFCHWYVFLSLVRPVA